jgi:hypothetical protein
LSEFPTFWKINFSFFFLFRHGVFSQNRGNASESCAEPDKCGKPQKIKAAELDHQQSLSEPQFFGSKMTIFGQFVAASPRQLYGRARQFGCVSGGRQRLSKELAQFGSVFEKRA